MWSCIKLASSETYFKSYNITYNDNITLSNNIIENIITSNIFKFNDIDGIPYDIYNIYYDCTDAPIIIYLCNIDKPFGIVQLSVYMTIFYYIDFTNKNIIQLCDIDNGEITYYNRLLDILNIIDIKKTNEIKSKYYMIGFNHNIGHHVWNELTGLNSMNESYIDGYVIGPYDFFNVKDYMKNNSKLMINDFGVNRIKELNYLPVFLNKTYIDRDIVKFIKPINPIIHNHTIITISLKTMRRQLMNPFLFYIGVLNNLLNTFTYMNFKVYIIGSFKTNIIGYNENEIRKQNIIANNIINSIKSGRMEIVNMIGENIYDIFNHIYYSNIIISTIGTSVPNLLNWFYNKKIIILGPPESYGWLDANINVIKNTSAIMPPKDYIVESNGLQGEFKININKFNQFINMHLRAALKNKIICCGLPKTCTKTLADIFLQIGYTVNSNPICSSLFTDHILLDNGITYNCDNILDNSNMELFDVFQDIPYSINYKSFDINYNCKFILTIRDSEKWFESLYKYCYVGETFNNESSNIKFIKYFFGCELKLENKDKYIKIYENYNNNVIEYFKKYPNKLLVLNIPNEDNNIIIDKICSFLNINDNIKNKLKVHILNKNLLSTLNS